MMKNKKRLQEVIDKLEGNIDVTSMTDELQLLSKIMHLAEDNDYRIEQIDLGDDFKANLMTSFPAVLHVGGKVTVFGVDIL